MALTGCVLVVESLLDVSRLSLDELEGGEADAALLASGSPLLELLRRDRGVGDKLQSEDALVLAEFQPDRNAIS